MKREQYILRIDVKDLQFRSLCFPGEDGEVQYTSPFFVEQALISYKWGRVN